MMFGLCYAGSGFGLREKFRTVSKKENKCVFFGAEKLATQSTIIATIDIAKNEIQITHK
jgi:hypothetical protein